VVSFVGALGVGVLSVGAAEGNQAVGMQSRQYEPKELTVPAGTTVEWTNNEAIPHSVTADDGSFDSHPSCGGDGGTCLKQGEKFRQTFSKPGTYPYFCHIHGAKGGGGMSGVITVTETKSGGSDGGGGGDGGGGLIPDLSGLIPSTAPGSAPLG
jgi:plastocyanin